MTPQKRENKLNLIQQNKIYSLYEVGENKRSYAKVFSKKALEKYDLVKTIIYNEQVFLGSK